MMLEQHPPAAWRLRLLVALSFVSILALYLVTLDKVPAVYVDEPWLAERALARLTVGEFAHWSFPYVYGSIGDINPLMTWLHRFAIDALGYNLFAIRLVSLGAFALTLWLWYLIVARRLGVGGGLAFLWLYSLSLMVFFSAHIARFEAPIMLVLTAALFLGANLQRLLPTVPRFLLVGLLGSTALFIHAPGVIAPVVAAVMAVLLLGLPPRQGLVALIAAAVGTVLGWALYLILMDWETVHWFFLGDNRRAAVAANLFDRLLSFPSLWWAQGVRGNWLIGPLHEGDLLAAGVIAWLLAAVWGGLISRRREALRVTMVFGFGAGLTVLLLGVYGRANYHYLSLVSPWLAAMLAGAMTLAAMRRLLWRVAVAGTLLVLLVRMAAYVGVSWRGNFNDYAASLTAAVPAGSRVLATIDNGLFFRPGYEFFAIDDLQGGDRVKGELSAGAYLDTYGIEYVVINANDRLWLGRERNQPWGGGLLAELQARGHLMVQVDDDYFFTGLPGFHGSPNGGVLGALRARGAGEALKPVTEVWRIDQQTSLPETTR